MRRRSPSVLTPPSRPRRARHEKPKKNTTMAVIGEFATNGNNSITGNVRTLTVSMRARLNPVERVIVDLKMLDADLPDELGVAGWAARLPIGSSDRQLLLEADDADTQLRILDDAIDGLAAAVAFAK